MSKAVAFSSLTQQLFYIESKKQTRFRFPEKQQIIRKMTIKSKFLCKIPSG